MNGAATKAMVRLADGNVIGALAAWHSVAAHLAERQRLTHGETSPIAEAIEALMATVRGGIHAGEGPRPVAPLAPRSAAWASAWAGDLAAARRLADAGPENADTLGVLGVVNVLERRGDVGLDLLDRALALQGGPELVPHRLRALLHLGRLDDARRALQALGDGESVGRRIVCALLQAYESRNDPRRFSNDCARFSSSETHLNGLFSTTLPAIFGPQAMEEAYRSPAALIALLEGLLDRMAGNLGLLPTVSEVGPDGQHRFVPLILPRTTRDQAAEALHQLPYVGRLRTEAALDAVLARHPRSVHARCYRGELYLWLGRYDEAWREFASVEEIEPARWADIGKIAVLTLSGRFAEGLELATSTSLRFPPIPGGTLPVYRGVLLRKMGQLDRAIDDLTFAVAAKPGRLGARIELCLALRAVGRRDEALAHSHIILAETAPLLVDVAMAAGLDWLRNPTTILDDEGFEASLSAMRGNRSSSVVTWIDGHGELRMVHRVRALRERAAEVLAEIIAKPATSI